MFGDLDQGELRIKCLLTDEFGIKGNDGLVRIGVPVEILAVSESDDPPDPPPDNAGDVLRLEKQVSVLETEVRMLRERQDDLAQDRDQWRNMAQKRIRWWPF